MDEQDIRQVLADYIEDNYDGSAKNFAEDNGISPSYVSDALSGKRSLGKKLLDAIGYEKQISYVPFEVK